MVVNDVPGDLQVLASGVLDAARALVELHGGFHPFAALLTVDGNIVGIDVDEFEHDGPLVERLRARLAYLVVEGRYLGAALAFDAILAVEGDAESQDAVAIELDHCDGLSVDAIQPYALVEGRAEFGAWFFEHGTRNPFEHAAPVPTDPRDPFGTDP